MRMVAKKVSRLYMRVSLELITSAGESATSAAAIRADVLPTASRAHRQVTAIVPMPTTTESDRRAASESLRSVIQPFSNSTYNGGMSPWEDCPSKPPSGWLARYQDAASSRKS